MSHETYRSRTYRRPAAADRSDTMDRVRAYLRSRPTESWLFFAAGILAGVILG